MNAQHTPTPWHIMPNLEIGSDAYTGIPGKQAIGQLSPFLNYCPNDCREEAKANAAFIVRACNSHEALVAALRNQRVILEGLIHPSCRRKGDAIEQIDVALAQAGEA